MNDIPVPVSPSSYGNIDDIPDPLKSCIQEEHDKLTIQQLQSCRDYFQSRIDTFRSNVEQSLTIEDFENAKKEDMDGDNGEGEKGEY